MTQTPKPMSNGDGSADASPSDSPTIEAKTATTVSVRFGIVASVALLAAAAILTASSLTGAWLWSGADDGTSVGIYRDDILSRGPTAYESALLNWPLVFAASVGLAGGILLAASLLARTTTGPRRAALVAAWILVCYGSFLGMLVACRWVGFVLTRALDPGPALFRLGAAPITLLVAAGLGVAATLASYGRLIGPTGRRSARSALLRLQRTTSVIAATVLVVLPLLPVARSALSPTQYYDELTLEVFRNYPGHPATQVGQALALARGMLWLVMVVAWAAWAALGGVPGLVGARGRNWAAVVSMTLVVPLGILAWATYDLYQQMLAIPEIMKPTFYGILVVGAVALLGCWVRGAVLARRILQRPAPALAQ
jgi:hypothetical protein